MTIYLVNTYREFVEKMIFQNKHVRGYKSRLAEAAGCHSSHLSQVLKGTVDLSLDQAMNLATFWRLDENETDFFLDLLLWERAGNPRLKEFYEHRLRRSRETREVLKGKFAGDQILPDEAATLYYSSWHYSAVHALALTREYSSVDRMASRLRMPAPVIKEALASLEVMGVLRREGDRWKEVAAGVFLPRNSPANAGHQASWRQRAAANIQSRDPEALHFIHVHSVSRSDFTRIKAKIAECMEQIREITQSSGDEDAVAVAIDFFRL